jgi:hypothetical protein
MMNLVDSSFEHDVRKCQLIGYADKGLMENCLERIQNQPHKPGPVIGSYAVGTQQ